MSTKTYIWKGPPTAVDILDETPGKTGVVIYSGRVTTGKPIPVALNPSHTLVASWLAFRLIEEATDSQAPDKPRAPGRASRTEKTDG